MKELEKHILLQKLQQGTISPAEYRTLELLALDDDFLFEALEGYQTNSHHIQDISELKNRVQLRTQKEAKRRVLWIPVSAIAATLVGFLFLSWWMFQSDPIQNFADSNDKSTEISALEETSESPIPTDGFENEKMEREELDQENESFTGVKIGDMNANTRQSKPSTARAEADIQDEINEEMLNEEAKDDNLENYSSDTKESNLPQSQPPAQPNIEANEPATGNIPVESSDSAMGQVMQKSESAASTKTESKKSQGESKSKINVQQDGAGAEMNPVVDGQTMEEITANQAEPIMGFDKLKIFIRDNSPLESRGNYVLFQFEVDPDGQIQDLTPIRYSSEKWIKLAKEIMLASGKWKTTSNDPSQVVFYQCDF